MTDRGDRRVGHIVRSARTSADIKAIAVGGLAGYPPAGLPRWLRPDGQDGRNIQIGEREAVSVFGYGPYGPYRHPRATAWRLRIFDLPSHWPRERPRKSMKQ